MSNDIKHTPTPWHEVTGYTPNITYIKSEDGETVCDLYYKYESTIVHHPNAQANAAHIVKCVNSHDALIAALSELLSAAKYQMVDEDGVMHEDDALVVANAEATLKLAKGE